jgi:hypothetical protein
MGMSTGAKIAIGCGVVAILGMVVLVAVIGVGAFWAKGKVEEMAGGLEGMTEKAEEIDRWETQANANPYTAPADGVIPEARFVKFLDVRKAVYSIYEQHRAELERLAEQAKNKEVSVSDTLEGMGRIAGLTTDLRLALVKALADVGMSEEEYRAIQMAVYKTAWASEIEEDTGQLPAEAMRQQAEEMPAEAERAAEEAQASPDSEVVSPEAMGAAAEQAAEAMRNAARAVEVPRQNVELFRKYKDDIQKYAMNGLAMIGM